MICSNESKCADSTIVCPDDGLCVIDCSTVTRSGPSDEGEACEGLDIFTGHDDGRFIQLICNVAVCKFMWVLSVRMYCTCIFCILHKKKKEKKKWWEFFHFERIRLLKIEYYNIIFDCTGHRYKWFMWTKYYLLQ